MKVRGEIFLMGGVGVGVGVGGKEEVMVVVVVVALGCWLGLDGVVGGADIGYSRLLFRISFSRRLGLYALHLFSLCLAAAAITTTHLNPHLSCLGQRNPSIQRSSNNIARKLSYDIYQARTVGHVD
jgi:hypothetical protein